MTAYTLAANATLRDIGNASIWGVATARTGGDTIDLNGFTFTQDQDNRYGFSGSTSATWGNITINATKGGKWIIDATNVWLIPFTGGSGTLTLGTQITIGGVTCNTIGIYTSLTVAPATTGASGWLKVTNASGTPGTISNGTYAGFTLTANGSAVRGWIEVNGDEAAGVIANRLGSFEMKGAWFEVGTTSGSSATTYQLPTNGISLNYYIPAVYVDSDSVTITSASYSGGYITYECSSHNFVVGDELTVTSASPSGYNVTDNVITSVTATTFTIAGSDPGSWTSGGSAKVMEAYPCAGSLVSANSTATDATRGKVCWVGSSFGLLRFGSDGTNTVGYIPPSGRRIRICNIITASNTTAARSSNSLSTTLATRYDFTTTGGGVIIIEKANLNWYPSFAQAFSVNLKYAAIAEQLSLSEIAQPLTITRCAVGQAGANAQFGLLMSLCLAGGTFNGNVWTSATLAASGRYIQSITDITGFTFNKDKTYSFVLRANNTTGAATLTRAKNCTWNSLTMGLGQFLLTTCSDLEFNNTTYFDCITTTGTSFPMSVWLAQTNSTNLKFDGLTFGGLTNVHPYTAILSVNSAGCSNIKLRNIGTSPSSQLSLGSANQTGTVVVLAGGAVASSVKIQMVFTSGTRTNLISGDNSSTGITLENVMGDYADVPVASMLNMICKGVGATPTYGAQTAVYGTHWWDHFTSATVGRIAVVMNEPATDTTSQVTLTNGAAFTSAGGLYMPTVGMTATFEMPYYSLGHSGFQNSDLVMAGGTVGNYRFEYAIDKNDGNGFSTMTSSSYTAAGLGTALNGLTGIDAALGFKLKLKITTTTTNTTAITSVYILTNSSSAAQANYYPLDLATVEMTGLVSGSDIVILDAGTTTEIVNIDANSGSTYSTQIDAGTYGNIDICIYKQGYVPYTLRNLSLTSEGLSLPINQVADRNFVS